MLRYRLSDAAQADVMNVLAWTQEQFGEDARLRYESTPRPTAYVVRPPWGLRKLRAAVRFLKSLIVAALRDVARQPGRSGSIERPKLGPVFGRGTCD
jgi:toxin ParE1/3/4